MLGQGHQPDWWLQSRALPCQYLSGSDLERDRERERERKKEREGDKVRVGGYLHLHLIISACSVDQAQCLKLYLFPCIYPQGVVILLHVLARGFKGALCMTSHFITYKTKLNQTSFGSKFF